MGTVAGAISESMSVLDGSTTPFVEFEDTLFDPHESLVKWIARGRAFAGASDRGVAMSIMVTETNLTPTWSNPMWESLEYDVKLEAARILKFAGSVAGLLPPPRLACAFGVDATLAALELCWQQCADYCPVWPGAEAVAPVVEIPADGENYILHSPAASSVDAACTRTPRQACQ